jgi:hypothetical protein
VPHVIPVRFPRAAVLFRAALLSCATATAASACTAAPATLVAAGPWQAPAGDPPAAVTRVPPAVSVLASTAPDGLTAAFAARLFKSAPVVVVAADTSAALRAAEQAALSAHAPLLVSASPPGGTGAQDAAGTADTPLVAEIKVLNPRAVLAVRVAAARLAARLPGIRVITRAALLPKTRAAAPLRRVAVLVRAAGGQAPSTGALTTGAITTMARVAGAAVVTVGGYDPRAYPAAIRALAKARPREVVAIGAGFGPASRLAARLAVAATGVQLPGGGQVLFPGHRIVALYGNPTTPYLGVLGQQDLPASITRAERAGAMYRPLSRVPVVPAFEIIATVAQGSPGPDGTYSYQTPPSTLEPWVREATAAGLYVILDLQPGRANLLTQARVYQSLLEQPDVGLALDAEWKLQPGQLPLRQIGSVSIGEVNSVVRWLAALTASHHLPQKLLVLHQFRLSMVADERELDTSHDDLAIVIHMDGQGTPSVKLQTWEAVTAAAPPGVFFGWKDFTVKDHPMLTPEATMANTPAPVMISYQ